MNGGGFDEEMGVLIELCSLFRMDLFFVRGGQDNRSHVLNPRKLGTPAILCDKTGGSATVGCDNKELVFSLLL